MDTKKIVIMQMTESEHEEYKRFKKYQQIFVLMDVKGIFDIKFGKCIINFYKGNMQNIVKEEMVYSLLHEKQA